METITQETGVSIRIRPFQWSDSAELHRLMHEVGDRYHRAEEHAIEDFDAEMRAPRANAGRNVFLAEHRGELAGYAVVVPDLNIARAVIRVGVSLSLRRRGLGLALLNRALERSRAVGARLAHVPGQAGDLASGALLQTSGFVPARHFLRMVCVKKPPEGSSTPGGFRMRALALEEAIALAALQNTVFESAWGYSPQSGEEVAAALALPGRGPERILVLCDADRLVAYASTHLFRQSGAGAGIVMMTGVHPAYRRIGLGEAVASAGVRSLFEAGAATVELEVDSTNALAVGMYERLQFRRRGGTFWYERRLK